MNKIYNIKIYILYINFTYHIIIIKTIFIIINSRMNKNELIIEKKRK